MSFSKFFMAKRSEAFVLWKTGGRQNFVLLCTLKRNRLAKRVHIGICLDIFVTEKMESRNSHSYARHAVRSSDVLEGHCCFIITSIILLTLKFKQTQNEKKRKKHKRNKLKKNGVQGVLLKCCRHKFAKTKRLI